nr:uncharacterized protein LOC102461789 isoform X2 [Pelodiscus sinensis]|eukprot:XP_025039582.1 uncharacterized protein LOC102461789 isoform X2 [Pelodiscus sinensis]
MQRKEQSRDRGSRGQRLQREGSAHDAFRSLLPCKVTVKCLMCSVLLVALILSLVVALAVVASRRYTPSCPDSWVGYQRKCYYFSETEGNWDFSRSQCLALGTSVTGIDSLQELVRFAGKCGKKWFCGGDGRGWAREKAQRREGSWPHVRGAGHNKGGGKGCAFEGFFESLLGLVHTAPGRGLTLDVPWLGSQGGARRTCGPREAAASMTKGEVPAMSCLDRRGRPRWEDVQLGVKPNQFETKCSDPQITAGDWGGFLGGRVCKMVNLLKLLNLENVSVSLRWHFPMGAKSPFGVETFARTILWAVQSFSPFPMEFLSTAPTVPGSMRGEV